MHWFQIRVPQNLTVLWALTVLCLHCGAFAAFFSPLEPVWNIFFFHFISFDILKSNGVNNCSVEFELIYFFPKEHLLVLSPKTHVFAAHSTQLSARCLLRSIQNRLDQLQCTFIARTIKQLAKIIPITLVLFPCLCLNWNKIAENETNKQT